MLNVLVVDDEPKHRQGLSRMLKNLRPEYHIFNARDGAEALERMEAHPIDLVFTDIQMPIMDGLEFVEHLTRRGGSESVVILSAYSDFAYAQRALQLGANDYLLKPVEAQKVTSLLQKAEHKAGVRRKATIESALSELLEGNPSEADITLLQSSFPDWRRGISLGAMVHTSAADRKLMLSLLKRKLAHIMEETGLAHAFYTTDQWLTGVILSSDGSFDVTCELELKLQELMDHIQKEHGQELTLGLGNDFTEWRQGAHSSNLQARFALQSLFYEGPGKLYKSDPVNPTSPSAIIHLDAGKLAKAILSGKKDDIYACLKTELDRTLAHGYPDPSRMKYSVAASIQHVTSILMEKGLSHIPSAAFEGALLRCSRMDELRETVFQWVLEMADHMDQRRQCKSEAVIDSCKAYIETNYGEEDLSLSTLAMRFHFNPSYFCILFKNHTRMTIHQYITHIRMRAAASQLLQTSQKVYQVAENVGYRDVKYFIRLFRKEYGTSPDEYRHLSATRI
ncbi:two-component system response regulator YesN [Paenibacillus rhizosphaerae]|uniref:Two-component system response regulator YesN n=1 Tax=Paenibacillus rhizosphaerae TaxID=297318 RepID=A0A839TK51_9BACL|nr:response regulator [Paenibacillus rhizosphaerae]MBB3126893.1 two-component system response regulator YesN [Paenibacillus rhizosphaerae]